MNKLTNKYSNAIKGYHLSEEGQAQLNKIHINGNSKVAKSIVTLVLCATMALSAISLTACRKTPNPDLGPGTSTEQPEKPGTSSYSKILQTVLTDKYYTNIIDEMRSNITVNKYLAIPFGLLQKQGHDVEKVKYDELECISNFYLKGNDTSNLYCLLAVENKNAKDNYFTNYHLKYSLSSAEYNDIKMLIEGRYLQAPLFLQEMSYQKNATILSSANIEKDTFKNLNTVLQNKTDVTSNFNNSKDINAIVTNFYKPENTCFIDVIVYRAPINSGFSNGKSASLTMKYLFNTGANIDNNVLSVKNTKQFSIDDLEEFKASIEAISFLNCASSLGNNLINNA